MVAHERKDWNLFKQIFSDHWKGFTSKHPMYDTAYHNSVVEKMLDCGNPEKMGYIEYLCMHCGQGRRLISMSCKSPMCLRCGKVYVDNWVSQVSEMLHPGVIYRHIVLTVPEVLRKTFFENDDLLGPFFHCGVSCLDDFFSITAKQVLRGGYIVVLQTNSRSGEYNPHLHIIGTSGGITTEEKEWKHLGYMPYNALHRKWQWYLLEMLKRELGKENIGKLVDDCYVKYPKGFVANVQKGDVPSRYRSLAKYLAKYVVSPPISVKRIDCYDGEQVTYHYRSHKTECVEQEILPVYRFIGRMIQHVLPKGFKRIRYYGVQATKTFEKVKVIIETALAKVKGAVKDGIQVIARKDYRARYTESMGVDPLLCPHCRKEMELWRIWHPKHGYIYDALEVLKKGIDASKAKEILGEGGDRNTLWPSAEGIQLSLSLV